MVDGKYKKEKDKTVYVPRTPEEMASLQQIVKAAMGFSEERGDDVSVVNVAFSARPAKVTFMHRILDVLFRLVRPLINLILALIFIFMVLKPLLNRYVLYPPELPGAKKAPALEGAGPEGEGLPPPSFEVTPDVTGELRDLADKYPERAAALIKIWLREQRKESEDAEST